MKIIDPHLHLFNLKLGQYNWLKPEQPPFWPDKFKIQQDFSEQDLIVNSEHEIVGFVHVEAGFNNQTPTAEIQWLNRTVKRPFKAVACIDLTLENKAFKTAVNELITYHCVSGVRHILDDNAQAVLSSPHVLENFKYLERHNLNFDLQMSIIDAASLPLMLSVMKACPKLKVIINHAGWPPITDSRSHLVQSEWYKALKQLAAFPQCAVKCSGWEMVDRHYDAFSSEQTSWLSSVINLCLQMFGEQRVMLASNFPLCLFHSSYLEYWDNVIKTLNELPLTEQKKQALVFNNACSWYSLNLV